jgi:hypothetical protein
MSGSRKSILVKSSSKRKTKKHVRINSPANQTFEFERPFERADIPGLWSTNDEFRSAVSSTEDKNNSKRSTKEAKKKHADDVKLRENQIFVNRKNISRMAALSARDILGINDVDSPTQSPSHKKKRTVKQISWGSDHANKLSSIRSSVSASQLAHEPSRDKMLIRARKTEPGGKIILTATPREADAKKKSTKPLTMMERLFGKMSGGKKNKSRKIRSI